MRRRYIPRALEPVLRKAASQFPAVVLTGPRQSGEDLGEKAGLGFVVHPGDVRLPLAPSVVALPFTDL